MEQLQTTLVTFVLLSSAILQAVVQPRQVKRENYIEMASLCCLVLDAAAVQAVAMPTTRTTLETVQNFLLVTNGIVVVVLVLGMLAPFFWQSSRERDVSTKWSYSTDVVVYE